MYVGTAALPREIEGYSLVAEAEGNILGSYAVAQCHGYELCRGLLPSTLIA